MTAGSLVGARLHSGASLNRKPFRGTQSCAYQTTCQVLHRVACSGTSHTHSCIENWGSLPVLEEITGVLLNRQNDKFSQTANRH